MPITINGTTGIAGVDGSAGTPAVQGTDTNTGIFFPAADTVAISAAGSEDFRIGPAGQIGLQGANYGTSGQVLTSGGASAAPSWSTLSSGGTLIRAPQILTSGTSYTTPSNCTKIYVEAVGGGGSGASSQGTARSNSGGGGGAYCAKYFTVTGNTAYTYAIGSGGAAIAYNVLANGNSGGNTTFTVGATTITAGGGGGGTYSASATDSYVFGGSGGTASNGDLNVTGGAGGMSLYRTTGTSIYFNGSGGGSVFSPKQPDYITSSTTGPIAAGNAGYSGASYGGGGGGSSQLGGGASGAGIQGMIRIWEFT